MSRLVYSMMVSLDGYCATADGSIDWVLVDEELHGLANDEARRTALSLYGRRMYETMAAFWPTAEEEPDAPEYIREYARLWKRTPRVVFSTALAEVGHGSRLASGDVAAEVRRLKASTDGEISVGGPTLAAACLRARLVDELLLFVHPVVLGGGLPYWPAGLLRTDLRTLEDRRLASGVVLLRYEVAAPAA